MNVRAIVNHVKMDNVLIVLVKIVHVQIVIVK